MHIINCSLNPLSNGRKVFQKIVEQNPDLNPIDLIDVTLPHCNGMGQSAYGDVHVKALHDTLLPANGLLFVAPVYNWDMSSVVKNFMEVLGTPYKDILTGKVFHHKVIGIVAVAAVKSSFLAPLNLLNSFMVDFQAFIVPKHALITGEDIQPNGDINMTHVNETLMYFRKMAKALSDF